MTNPEYVADHSLLLALPAFGPAVILVGVVVFIAVRNRRSDDEPEDSP